MKTIHINFADFWKSFQKEDNYFYDILSQKYNVIISDEPEYLFSGSMGNEHLNYSCVKIFFTGENICPDFNLFDYALGFHNISFDDRYLRFPLYVLYPHAWQAAMKKHQLDDGSYLKKEKFCNYVVSNSIADPARGEMARILNSYKRVDSGGRYQNNVGGPVADKIQFASGYRFTLCFENSSSRGYTTEKIVEAFASATIPIYWGNPDIAKEFNPAAFINCHDYDNFEQVLNYVKEVDNNPELLLSMLKAPAMPKELSAWQCVQESYLSDFLSSIIEQPGAPAGAIRRNRIYIGARYEKRMRRYHTFDKLFGLIERPAYYLHNKMNCLKDR